MIKERVLRELRDPVRAWIAFLGSVLVAATVVPSPIVSVLNAVGTADIGTADGMPPVDLVAIGCAIVSIPIGVLMAIALIKMTIGPRFRTSIGNWIENIDAPDRRGWGRSIAVSLIAIGFAAIVYAIGRHPRGDRVLASWGRPEVDLLQVLLPSMVFIGVGACQFVLELYWSALVRRIGRPNEPVS